MNTQTKYLLTTFVSAFIIHTSAHAQGSLTPPAGAPAPVMKTLDQIEARTAISTVPYTISQPGSYYFTTNLTVGNADGITIITNGVTLDLNGFTLKSTAASGGPGYKGVSLGVGRRNVTIKNGFITGSVTNDGSGNFSGPGFLNGISSVAGLPENIRVSNISISGCSGVGISLAGNAGIATSVESCAVNTCGDLGIFASIINDCTVTACKNDAILGLEVSHCFGRSITGIGINALTGANNCYGYSETSIGVSTTGTATSCYGQSISGIGLSANVATSCVGNRPSGTAIQATIANGCYAVSGTNIITYKYNMP